ncbi:hypothetical protein [Buttiauxella warmboldiae]
MNLLIVFRVRVAFQLRVEIGLGRHYLG